MVEKLPEVEEAHVFDCVAREQWGRMVMLFGHATNTGGYIASGHAILDGNCIKIKLASGHYYRIEVDANLAHLQPFVCAEPTKGPEPKHSKLTKTPVRTNHSNVRKFEKPASRPESPQHPVSSYSDPNDESEDLTAEDLRRLRGEIPLSGSAKKKWKR